MKKIVVLFFCIASMQTAFAQDIDLLLHKIAAEKDNNIRFEMLISFFSNTAESNPLLDLKNAQKLLVYSRDKKDKIGEGLALTQIAFFYRGFGNADKSLEYLFDASEKAQQAENGRLLAYIDHSLGNVYKDLSNYPKAINYYVTTAAIGDKLKYDKAKEWAYGNMTDVYLAMDNIDSAFKYSQMDYEVSMRIHYYDYIGYTLYSLGAINGKMGNTELAKSYYNMSIQEGIKTKSPKLLNWAYTSRAQYFTGHNQRDSGIVYAKKAIAAVKNTSSINYTINPAKLLLTLYKNHNSDSALKYSEIYRIANDSLFSSKIIQQTQMMTFENEVKQEKSAQEKQKAEEERQQNIQYALIALSIVIFIILFLLLSRTVIINGKLISFFAVLGLLILFEFINLLIHPWLAHITHESPVLMLLVLVLIASLLIPLHHRLEKWIKEKMTDKNKAIRLAAAMKTIKKLEKKPENS